MRNNCSGYNRLTIKNRLSHILQGTPVDRSCTFCSIRKNLPAPEENFIHLFWYCETTSGLLSKLTEKLIPELMRLLDPERKLFILTGISPVQFPLIIQMTRKIFLYLIWEMHQKNKVWHWETFRVNLVFELKKISAIASPLKLGLNTGFYLSAHWDDITRVTW